MFQLRVHGVHLRYWTCVVNVLLVVLRAYALVCILPWKFSCKQQPVKIRHQSTGSKFKKEYVLCLVDYSCLHCLLLDNGERKKSVSRFCIKNKAKVMIFSKPNMLTLSSIEAKFKEYASVSVGISSTSRWKLIAISEMVRLFVIVILVACTI